MWSLIYGNNGNSNGGDGKTSNQPLNQQAVDKDKKPDKDKKTESMKKQKDDKINQLKVTSSTTDFNGENKGYNKNDPNQKTEEGDLPPVAQETVQVNKETEPTVEGKDSKYGDPPPTPAKVVVVAPPLDRAIAEEEKILKDLDYYHGFLPREDLSYILRADGDYILRVSEVQMTTDSNKNANTTANQTPKREIILSVMTEVHNCGPHAHSTNTNQVAKDETKPSEDKVNEQQQPQQNNANHPLEQKLRNVVVRRTGGKYSIESARLFETVRDLVQYYAINTDNQMRLSLKTPVKLQAWEFLHSAVKLGVILGEGAYGEVRQGVLNRKNRNYDVAVKLTKGAGDLCKAKIREMMKEARLMRNFKHKNIVRLYGVAVGEQPLYILLELIKGGALNKYLQTKGNSVTIKEKMLMCLGAARGLEYLHEKKCIHRDIAARNCLYSEDKVVKISDFGLSRLGNMYKLSSSTKLPIKWLAPETIMKHIFTLKTDVFSYGVLCFEVFTNGEEPWDNITNTEAKKLICSGTHLPLPPSCPEKVKVFICDRIYVKDSQKRITMQDVARFLDAAMMDQEVFESKEPVKEKEERSTFQQIGQVSATSPGALNSTERTKKSRAVKKRKATATARFS